MLHLYLDLVNESIGDTLSLVTRIAEKYLPDDEAVNAFSESFEDIVWERMRACDEMPGIHEIYTSVVVDYTQLVLDTLLPDADNGVEGSHNISISINNNEIYNWRSFVRAYKEYLEEQADEEDEEGEDEEGEDEDL